MSFAFGLREASGAVASQAWEGEPVVMWQRFDFGGSKGRSDREPGQASDPASRRAYYRVSSVVPLRVRPLARDEVEAAIYDLSLPDPLTRSAESDGEAPTAMSMQLRRIEEKLDRLLAAAGQDAPQPLSGRDRKRVTFSGNGLSLEVDFEFRRGDAFRIDLLLPPVYPARIVRAVGEAVWDASDPAARPELGSRRRLALSFRHIEDPERDALVAYSYDVQRRVLRARRDEAAVGS